MLAVCSIATQARAAERYALAVGVSRYPKPLPQLEGPRNDVTLMVNTLLETRWADRDHIRVLADDLSHAYYPLKVVADGAPTIAEIRKGFDWLLTTAQSGDEVVIYFSGHGSYVPALERPGEAPEPDGVDEVFLPIDIGEWSDSLHGLRNQLIDNEIGAFLAKMRTKGAKVWLIADSCNSGTLSRAGATVRSVNPVSLLGVPARAFAQRSRVSAARGIVPATQPIPSFVGFYAALPSLDAIEARVPLAGKREDLRTQGLFTWYLVRAIRSGQTASFERMAQAILAGYSEWQGAAPIPMFEGDLAGPTAFASRGGRIYSLASSDGRLAVKAGIVDGIDEGTRFNLIDLRKAVPMKVGTARATTSAPERTAIEVNVTTPPATSHSIAADPEAFGAQVTSLGISLRLSVTLAPLPSEASEGDHALYRRVATDLAALLALPAAEQTIALAPAQSADSSDVRLIVRKGILWFAPTTGESAFPDGSVPPFLEAEKVDRTSVAAMLGQIGHGRNLLRAADLLKDSEVSRGTRIRVLRTGQDVLDGRCPRHLAGQAAANGSIVFDTQSRTDRLARFVDCDLVTVEVTNAGRRSIGVTPLYVDSWQHIDFLPDYRESSDSAMIVEPGAAGVVSYTETLPRGAEAKRSGRAQLVLLLSVVDDAASVPQDYRSLATGALHPMRADAMDPRSSGFLLAAAGAGQGAVRSAAGAGDAGTGAVIVPLGVSEKR